MSAFGARRGHPDYDRFRTGLTYYDVYQMAQDRKYRRRRGVLGLWNQLKREMFYLATGVSLCLFVGCGTITTSALSTDAGTDSTTMPEVHHEAVSPDDANTDGGADAGIDVGAPTTCQWDGHAPHEVVKCEGGAGWSCHYLDSAGRPDGYLTGCQVDGQECVFPCP